MLAQKPDRLLRIILGWTAVTMVFVWLPLIRGPMDGPSYLWGTSYWGLSVGGSGVSGDYWLLVVQGLVGLSILAIGWRGARPPFHLLLLLWHGVLGSSAVYAALRNPDQYRFRGDTLGIDVSLAWAGPLFFGGFFVLAVLWTLRDRRRRERRIVPPWTRANTSWLAVLLAMLPVQFVLLRFGEVHGLTDRIGVLLTIAQCLLLGRIFRPAAGRTSAPFTRVA
jgi:hypothetical protein